MEPLVEGNVGALEDGAGAYREFQRAVAATAVAEALGDLLAASAMRAHHVPVPSPSFQVQARRLDVGEELE